MASLIYTTAKNKLIPLAAICLVAINGLTGNATCEWLLALVAVILPVLLIVKARNNWPLLIIGAFIAYCTWSFVSVFYLGNDVQSEYMVYKDTYVAIIGLNIVTLFNSILLLMVPSKIGNYPTAGMLTGDYENPLIVVACLLMTVFLGVTGFGEQWRGARLTISTWYEYSIILAMIAIWFSAGKKRWIAPIAAVIVFRIALDFWSGNRITGVEFASVGFFMLLSYRLRLKHVIPAAIVMMIAVLWVGELRAYATPVEALIGGLQKYFSQGLAWNGAYSAYHTSLCFVDASLAMDVGARLNDFSSFITSIFLGGSVEHAMLSQVVYPSYWNMGGGYFPFHFYYYFGYVGVISASILLGTVLRLLANLNDRKKQYFGAHIVTVCWIVCTVFRWYQYYPFVLIRGTIITAVAYAIAYLFDLLCRKLRARVSGGNPLQCYIHGSFLSDNFGDFLLYDVTERLISGNFENVQTYSTDVSKAYNNYTNVIRKSRFDAAASADIAVLTGGGYFGEPGNRISACLFEVEFIMMHLIPLLGLVAFKVPYIIVGLGVGPLTLKISKWGARVIFSHAQSVFVRDSESKQYIEHKLGVDCKVGVLPDIVMGSDIDYYLDTDEIPSNLNCGTEYRIGVHLVTRNTHEDKGTDGVLAGIKSALASDEFLSKKSTSLLFLCDQGSEKQTKRSQYNAEYLDCTSDEVFPYRSAKSLCSLLSTCDLVITDKLHVGIVATRLGKAVISVASHPKAKRFYRQIGNSEQCISLHEADATKVKEMIENTLRRSPSVSNTLELIESESAKNMNEVRRFVEEQGGVRR